jgi:hypothetical protein
MTLLQRPMSRFAQIELYSGIKMKDGSDMIKYSEPSLPVQ